MRKWNSLKALPAAVAFAILISSLLHKNAPLLHRTIYMYAWEKISERKPLYISHNIVTHGTHPPLAANHFHPFLMMNTVLCVSLGMGMSKLVTVIKMEMKWWVGKSHLFFDIKDLQPDNYYSLHFKNQTRTDIFIAMCIQLWNHIYHQDHIWSW